MNSKTYSNTARSERQYATMLLPHLLLGNGFAGLAALFRKLGLPWDVSQADIEAVAELNPIRDVPKASSPSPAPNVGTDPKVAVPDLFFRNGNIALVIEAKFFTYPDSKMLLDQLQAQKAAIEGTLSMTSYRPCQFHYLALTVVQPAGVSGWPNGFSHMTWTDSLKAIEPVVVKQLTPDMDYALRKIREAILRSVEESDSASNEVGRVSDIKELVAKALTLTNEGIRYVGYVGGEDALIAADLQTLESRSHYKYAERVGVQKNWIPLETVVARYLLLKAEQVANLREERKLTEQGYHASKEGE